jgi:adenine-specific DNA-methyltransferase
MSLLLKPTLLPSEQWSKILLNIDMLSQEHALTTGTIEKRENGQIFTPLHMARQLISLIKGFDNKASCYGDPGTGTGILSAALLARHSKESETPPKSLQAYETDKRLHSNWRMNFSEIGHKLSMKHGSLILSSNFYKEAKSILETGAPANGVKATTLVMNPPYKKLGVKEEISILLKEHGIYAPNHYAAFLSLSVCWLKQDGEVLAIIPRSFFNGRYFKRFRAWLSSIMSIEHVVVYRSRSNFCKNILQENICLLLKKRKQCASIRISYCEHAQAPATYDLLIPKEQVLGLLWKLPSSPEQLDALKANQELPNTLSSLGIIVKTGAVEVHRVQDSKKAAITVLYSRDFNSNGEITWLVRK